MTANRKHTAWLEAQFNNRARVPAFADHLARWGADSATARSQLACQLDLAYGGLPEQNLDVFLPAQPAANGAAPVWVFVHGGYWRSLDKAQHSFVAPPVVAQGAVAVVINYRLCPGATLPEICLDTAQALAYIWRNAERWGADRRRLSVAGHSAGGHLAAMMLLCQWPRLGADLPADLVQSALSVSGLFDLSPLRQTPSLQADLRLRPAQIRKASPALLPAPSQHGGGRGRLSAVVGGDESAAFLQHNAMIRKAWGKRAVPVCERLSGLNHFSALEAMTQTGSRLHALVSQQLQT